MDAGALLELASPSAANGLGGFAHHGEEGFHLGVKRWLLRHEGAMLL